MIINLRPQLDQFLLLVQFKPFGFAITIPKLIMFATRENVTEVMISRNGLVIFLGLNEGSINLYRWGFNYNWIDTIFGKPENKVVRTGEVERFNTSLGEWVIAKGELHTVRPRFKRIWKVEKISIFDKSPIPIPKHIEYLMTDDPYQAMKNIQGIQKLIDDFGEDIRKLHNED